METNQATMTAEELLALGDMGRCELIEGELVRMSPGGFEHGTVASRIDRLIGDYVERHQLGLTTAAETGFRVAHNPDTVRAPDVGFISTDRIPKAPRRGFFEGSPDLAVEVISPEDRWSEVTAKANVWLQAGAKLVWLVDPLNRTVTVYTPSETLTILREQDTLDAGQVLPGFQVLVRDFFPTLLA